MRSLIAAISMLACCLYGSIAAAIPPQGILFTEQGHPLSLIPGRSDGMALSSFFVGQVAYSPSGKHWVATAATNTGQTILLSGTPSGISSVAVQNEPMSGLGLAFSQTPGSLAINDDGDFAFGMQVLGGSAANRVMVARYSATTRTYMKVARQSETIPGLNVPGAVGERYGSTLSVAAILRDGRVGLVAKSTTGPLPTDRDDFLLIAGRDALENVEVRAQAGVLVPTGQNGGATAVLANLDRDAGMSSDAAHWLVWGQLGSASFPDAVIIDGRVRIQEGRAIPGLTGDVFLPSVQMFGSGAWTVRGTSSAGQRYLIVNGRLRVVQGFAPPGLPELGIVSRVDSAALNARGDLAYSMSTIDGRAWIIIEPAFGTPYVAVSENTELTVRGSVRGPIFYGGPLSSDQKLGLGNDGTLYFFTRARDRVGLNTSDGLFMLPSS
jgi:hypothetical protein